MRGGYYSLVVAPEFRKFLGFIYNNEAYCYNRMPMGVRNGTSHFYYFLLPLKQFIDSIVPNSLEIYIDDLIIHNDDPDIVSHLIATILYLLHHEFKCTVNLSKSSLCPTETLPVLGFIIDKASTKIIPHRIDKIKLALIKYIEAPSRHHFNSLLGVLESTRSALRYDVAINKKLFALHMQGNIALIKQEVKRIIGSQP